MTTVFIFRLPFVVFVYTERIACLQSKISRNDLPGLALVFSANALENPPFWLLLRFQRNCSTGESEYESEVSAAVVSYPLGEQESDGCDDYDVGESYGHGASSSDW